MGYKFIAIIKMRLIFTLIICLTITSAFKDCNFSQFDFFSTYSLGKQDELNRTFTLLNQKMRSLPDILLNLSTYNYMISQAKA
jgi:hypothetical protein